MLHAKEPYSPAMFSLLIIMQEVLNKRADVIQADTQQELYVRYGSGRMAYKVVATGKHFICAPSFVCPVYGIDKAY